MKYMRICHGLKTKSYFSSDLLNMLVFSYPEKKKRGGGGGGQGDNLSLESSSAAQTTSQKVNHQSHLLQPHTFSTHTNQVKRVTQHIS